MDYKAFYYLQMFQDSTSTQFFNAIVILLLVFAILSFPYVSTSCCYHNAFWDTSFDGKCTSMSPDVCSILLCIAPSSKHIDIGFCPKLCLGHDKRCLISDIRNDTSVYSTQAVQCIFVASASTHTDKFYYSKHVFWSYNFSSLSCMRIRIAYHSAKQLPKLSFSFRTQNCLPCAKIPTQLL
jgi:hypothetical protein